MMMRDVAGVGLMEVPPLQGVALVLGGAHLHARHLLLGMEVLWGAITKKDHLLQKVYRHVVDLLVLEAHLPVILMLMSEGAPGKGMDVLLKCIMFGWAPSLGDIFRFASMMNC